MGLASSDDAWRATGFAVGAGRAVAAGAAGAPARLSSAAGSNRDAMDAILLVLRTGMQWNALNATGICSASSLAPIGGSTPTGNVG